LLELTDTWIGALPESQRLAVRCQPLAKGRNDGLANVVLRRALREQLQDDEIVVAVGEDAGKVIGFTEKQPMGIVLGGNGRKLAA